MKEKIDAKRLEERGDMRIEEDREGKSKEKLRRVEGREGKRKKCREAK